MNKYLAKAGHKRTEKQKELIIIKNTNIDQEAYVYSPSLESGRMMSQEKSLEVNEKSGEESKLYAPYSGR